jgi:hypothetical protein
MVVEHDTVSEKRIVLVRRSLKKSEAYFVFISFKILIPAASFIFCWFLFANIILVDSFAFSSVFLNMKYLAAILAAILFFLA